MNIDDIIKRAEAFNDEIYKQLFNKPDEAVCNDALVTHQISDDMLGSYWLLIQDLLTALKGKGWMPIESAPKDGTTYLLWDGDYIRRGSWKKDPYSDKEGWYDEHGDDFSTGSYYCPLTPTHFMYLPTPPTSEEK